MLTPHVATKIPSNTAREGKRKSFSEELLNKTAASRAQRHADSQFFAARGSARQKQASDVRGGDQQEQADGSEERQQGGADISHHGVRERRYRSVGEVNFLAILVSDSARNRIEIGAGLLDRCAIAKAAET